MLGLLPFQGVVYLLNQYHRALPWAKSKLCPFRAQADKTIFRKAQQGTQVPNLTNLIPISFENKILKRLRRLVIIVSKKQLAAKS